MKRIQLFAFALVTTSAVFISCSREAHENIASRNSIAPATGSAVPGYIAKSEGSGECNPNAYVVTLESKTAVAGGWEWVWSVQNPNPGNGNNGTAQNLSHWGMQFGFCFSPSSMVSAGYSADGVSWTNFTPTYQSDPSQSCMTSPVLKFDYGTTGSTKSYYKLVVNTDYATGIANAYYKSGGRTGCCTFSVPSLDCIDNENPR